MSGYDCAFPGCDHKRLPGRGDYCEGHRKQRQRGTPLRALRGPHGRIHGPCVECGGRRNVRGAACASCKSRWYRAKAKAVRRAAAKQGAMVSA